MSNLLEQLAEQGLSLDLPDGEYIVDALLIIKTTTLEGTDGPNVRIAGTPNMDWITRKGLLAIAGHVERGELSNEEEEEDDEESG